VFSSDASVDTDRVDWNDVNVSVLVGSNPTSTVVVMNDLQDYGPGTVRAAFESPGSPSLERREFLAVGASAFASSSLEPGTSPLAHRMPSASQQVPEVDALTFDVFGTVVDWRTSIIREGQLMTAEKGIEADWPAFADAWRAGYVPAMGRVRSGDLPWMRIDDLHRLILDDIAPDFGLDTLSEEELDHLNRVWHRLVPWPDSVLGLTRLRAKYMLVTLSNGNVALLANMAKNAGLPWDVVLSAELAQHYKPDPEVYQTAADLLGLPINRLMMVAAHKSDLRAARATGMRTAYVPRPLEYGPNPDFDGTPDPEFDVVAGDFIELAEIL
jgi:2-haloacid dehalogenase